VQCNNSAVAAVGGSAILINSRAACSVARSRPPSVNGKIVHGRLLLESTMYTLAFIELGLQYSWVSYKVSCHAILSYLSICTLPHDICVVTNMDNRISSCQNEKTSIAGSLCGDMEEADCRSFLQLKDAVENGCSSALIRSLSQTFWF